MRRKLAVTMLIMNMFLFILIPSTAYCASDPMNAASPEIEDIFDSAKNNNPYITTYRTNYDLDSTAGMFNVIEKVTNGLACILFAVQQGLANLLVVVFYYTFNFSFYDIFKDLINLFVGNMKTQVWDQISILIISFLGIFFFVKQLQRQVIQFWVTLLQTVLIVALALFYFSQPAVILKSLDDGTNEVSKMILAGSNNNGGANAAVVSASNSLWDIYVHQPWQYLEFGDKNLAQQYTDQVLSLPPGDDARRDIFDRLESQKLWSNMGVKRVGFEIMYLIPMLITFLILAVLCILTIGFQALLMVLFLLGIFVLVVALIPGWGPRILQNWIQKIIATAFTKIILVFFLTVLIAFNKALFTYAQTKGWIITLLLQLIIYIVIFLKRNDLIELFVSFRQTMMNPNAFNRVIMRTGEMPGMGYGYGNGYGSNRRGYSQRYMRNDYEMEYGEEEPHYRASGGDYSGGRTINRERYSDSPNYYQNEELKRDDAELQTANETKSAIKHSDSHQHEIKALLRRAEEVLEKQVEILRQEANAKAQRNNRSPEYDSRVTRADNRVKMGLPPFEQKDLIKTARDIQRVERMGGKAEDIVNRVQSNQTIRRAPASVVDIMERRTRQSEEKDNNSPQVKTQSIRTTQEVRNVKVIENTQNTTDQAGQTVKGKNVMGKEKTRMRRNDN